MVNVTDLQHGQPFTRADLEQVADDGHRYELVDGSLVVTPAPSPRHQRMSRGLLLALNASCPPELEVLFAPLDVALSDDTVLQPDLLVARRSDFTDRDLPIVPLLAVEVVSPSTRLVDLNLKFARYQAAGCPTYWVADPDAPAVTAWQLQSGQYVEVAQATTDAEFIVDSPYPLTLIPSRLLD